MPQWYLDEPLEGPLDNFYTNAFWTLNTTRRYEHGPIPWDIITEYAKQVGLDEYMLGVLVNVIRVMDVAYLNKEAEEQEANRRKMNPSKVR